MATGQLTYASVQPMSQYFSRCFNILYERNKNLYVAKVVFVKNTEVALVFTKSIAL